MAKPYERTNTADGPRRRAIVDQLGTRTTETSQPRRRPTQSLARTFVGFSSTDIGYYYLMCGWKAHDDIDFNFCDCQIEEAINSDSERYIKERCRARLEMAGTYIMLIGSDTRHKHKYVLWEAEVAIEKGCRLIGVNLDKWRYVNTTTCPSVLRGVDAMFVPFSSRILAHTIDGYRPPDPPQRSDRHWEDQVYRDHGYILTGMTANLPTPPNPFARW